MIEQALREDAPEGLARAREERLREHRRRLTDCRRLAIEDLAWLCRLDEAGHCGASRLIERVLERGDVRPRHAEMRSLATRHARIARHLALDMRGSDFDIDQLAAWLERAGGPLARLAEVVREIKPLQHADEFRALFEHLSLAQRLPPEDPQIAGHDLMARIAARRLRRAPEEERPAARALFERAAELGSLPALDALWMGRYEEAADKAAFVRDWLAANPSPRPVGKRQLRMLATALGAEDALPWYAAALGFALPAADACCRIGKAFEERWGNNAEALRWYERGIDRGERDSLSRWLDAFYRQELGLSRTPSHALERVQRFMAAGASPQLPTSARQLAPIAQFAQGEEREQWLSLIALLGYTPEMAKQDAAEAAAAARRRAGGQLEAAFDELPIHWDRAEPLLREVLAHGNDSQRARAQELLDGKGWPALPADELEMYWKACAKIAHGEPVDKPELFLKYLAALAREPSARADARFATLESVIASLRAQVAASLAVQPAKPLPDEKAVAWIELALGYHRAGDPNGARDLLRQVAARANDPHAARARALLATMDK